MINGKETNAQVPCLLSKIAGWHEDRNLINGSTDQAQYVKLIEEAGELASSIARGLPVVDDIGDMIVVLVNIAERNNLSIQDCLENSWEDIKDRRGRMVDGLFVKE